MHPADSEQYIKEQAAAAPEAAQSRVDGVPFDVVKAMGIKHFFRDPDRRWQPRNKKIDLEKWLAAVGK